MDVYFPLIFLALVAHQIFRRYETYSLATHAVLLLGPPVLSTLFIPRYPDRSLFGFLAIAQSIYLCALSAFVLLYRVSPFHPLARYPGPFLNKLSQWWSACISWGGYEYLYIQRLHKKYGDIVRIGPNEISICNPSAVTPVMGAGSTFSKGPQYVGRLLSDGVQLPLIGVMDTEEHLHRRRTWNKAFSAGALKEYEPAIARRTLELVSALESRAQKGEPVVLGEWFNNWAYDFMCDMAFGGGSELLRDGDANNVWKIIDEGLVIGTIMAHVPWLGCYLRHIPPAVAPLQALISHCRRFTEKRVKNGSAQRDLFHYLNNEDSPDKDTEPVPMHQLTDDGCLIVVAGADTTSSTLTSLFYLLLSHPEEYARLIEEVDKFYPSGEDVYDPKWHRDMHFLNAVINETLRLFPPVPNGSQRMVPHRSSGAYVGENYFAPGTSVWVHPYSMHRDPRNFSPFPNGFWPDRWLLAFNEPSTALHDISTASAERFVHNEDAYVPFAAGPMNCVGKSLALQEVRTVVCALLQRFRFHLVEEDGDALASGRYEKEWKAYLVATRPAVRVTVEVRTSAERR